MRKGGNKAFINKEKKGLEGKLREWRKKDSYHV